MTPEKEAYNKARGEILDAIRSSTWGKPVTSLSLGHCGLKALPKEIGELTKLERLVINGNPLTSLPQELGKLTSLTCLDVGSNQFSRLPDVLWNLVSLRELHIQSNGLTELPEGLTRLEHLETLDLRGNRLTTLPDWLPRLRRLRTLDLSGKHRSTPLKWLPECLSQMPQLEKLRANHCELESLPEWLEELRGLQTLDLSYNKLTDLPESLHRLAQRGTLKELFLVGNPGLGLPDEVLQKAWRPNKPDSRTEFGIWDKRHFGTLPQDIFVARGKTWGEDNSGPRPLDILDYYFRTRGKDGRELRELKLLVVGRGGAGKTTIIKRLRSLPRDPREPETHGITISPLDLRCALDGKQETVKARVWDFGGQHVLHSMHQFFLTARSLYLIVLNEREELAGADARYWLQIIRAAAGDVPVVIALNKSRGHAREMDRATLEREYGPILAWIPTECEPAELPQGTASDGLAALRFALQEAAAAMPGVRARFPVKWDQIKDWLETSAAPWLTYTDYQKGCVERGEKDPNEQDKLSGYLHDLGIALNYGRDPRLRETSVLRPDWLANGIYALLRANHPLHAQRLAPAAILCAQDLGRIYEAAEKLGMLEANDYPEARWPFLLRLMGAFQLSYPLDDAATQHLVPTLLPAQPPEGTDEPMGSDRTRLRYEGEPIPGPLLPRFLVRSYALVKNHLSWRNGAVFTFAGAEARVWLEDERRLCLTLAGPPEEREELREMLQGQLDELFAEYPHAKVTEQWEMDGEFVPRRFLEKLEQLPPKVSVRVERGLE